MPETAPRKTSRAPARERPASSILGDAPARLRALVSEGGSPDQVARLLEAVFVSRERSIQNTDFKLLDPNNVVRDYLLPRRELYRFTAESWISRVFLPTLKPRMVEGSLVFGLGRLFSSYNDMGIQRCTDVDINMIAPDDTSPAELSRAYGRFGCLKAELRDRFGFNLEVNPDFTLLRAKDVVARLTQKDPAARVEALRFYKSNERSVAILKRGDGLFERVFSLARGEPDSRLFENFLGLEGRRQSYAKIRAGLEKLKLVAEGGEAAYASAVIGSKPFDAYCRLRFPRKHFLSPTDWIFSMKYFVNRVYDYVAAMGAAGHGLEAIGLDRPDPELGADPDYRYLRDAHKLMLYLQELMSMVMGSYGADNDYGYVSRARFLRFAETGGDKFLRDFDEMVLKGELLYQSDAGQYRSLRGAIRDKAQNRYITGRSASLEQYPPDFSYELVYRDLHDYKIRVPYSWADLGFFAFSRIAERIAKIVDERLVPRLGAFGMPPEAVRMYSDRVFNEG